MNTSELISCNPVLRPYTSRTATSRNSTPHLTFSKVGKHSIANVETVIRKMLSSSTFSWPIVSHTHPMNTLPTGLVREAPLMTRNDSMMQVASLLVGGIPDDP